ncbi:protein phosphatase 1 regulatory subunit 3A isoform X2 [Channa argus]|uniref:protein phosphatase 1 regulatory subunit 3A isoform X2 n=1 Tax=Channa argus TaxID=215402 RepID=UPI003521AE85
MSSVTRLHLLSQSMLNVSCQKQKCCSSCPADSLTASPMECVGQARTSEACNLLDVPGLTSLDVDDDEGEVGFGIRPKSSPLPRRKSSVTDDDSEPEPPLCGSRRVSFADAKGLSLVQVKEFETWDEPKLPGYDFSEIEGKCTDKYFLSLHTFSLPLSTDELFIKVQDQKVELETIKLLPGTTTIKGVIRVLNISFSKTVFVRTTLDGWCSHFDLLAEYIPGSSDGLMDSFSFKVTLVPPFGEQGARVDFCLRYETPVGTFWANNNNRNYVLFCHRGMKDQKEKPQKENVNKKSCLKPVSQNLTVENISAVEASSQENISTVVLTQEEERNTVKSKQIIENQAETSEEREQKLQAEKEQNSSRRSRRRATRMARLSDDFAQRYGEADDTGRGAASPEAKHAAHNCTSASVPEKPESSDLADSANLTGGESTTDIPDNPLHSNEEPASAESQNINKSVSKADGKNLKHVAIDECISSIASDPADNVISAVSSKSLVSQANSFTFGTVVAPLYHQLFGRVGSENPNLDNRVNPVWATMNVRDLTQSYYHTKISENSSTVVADTGGNDERVQENDIESQESNQEQSDTVVEEKEEKQEGEEEEDEEETSFNVMENDTLQDPVEILPQRYTNSFQLKPKSGDTEAQPHIENILNMELGNALVRKESLYSHEEAQADNVTFDLQSQDVGETPHAQLSEHKCLQTEMISHETPAQIQTEEVIVSGENVFKSVEEAITENAIGKTVIISPSSVISEENKPKDLLHDLNSDPPENLFTKESANCYISCGKTVDENNFSTYETSLGTQDETNDGEQQNKLKNNLNEDEAKQSFEAGEELTDSMTNANQTCGDIGDMELKNEQLIVSQKEKHCEIEAAVSREEDFSFAEATNVKNLIVVKEEKNNILTDETYEKESKAIYLKDTEAGGGKGEQLGDAGIETENRHTKLSGKEKPDEARIEEITDPGKKENKTEDADALEVEHSIGEENTAHIVAGKNRDAEKKFEYVETTQMETIAGEDETEVEKIEEQEEKEKHFMEMEEVTSQKTNAEKKEDLEAREKIKIGLKAGVVREDQNEKGKDEKRNYKDEILVEAGEAEIVDAVSEGMTLEGIEDEVGGFQERLDIAQNVLEDGLFALVNNLKVRDIENTGEGQHAHIPTEMHFYKEEDLECNKKVTHDRSKAKNEYAAVEGCLSISTGEPESDQTSHSSASAESDSDDEVELYMHCLKAAHTGRQPSNERNKDAASAVSKRPSVSRSKHVSTPMPPISECLDEEQHLSCLQGNNEDIERTDIRPSGTTFPGGQDHITRNIAWWKKTISCSNISKILLCALLLVVFLVAAYHYDFLACFGLYLVSVVWLCRQGETQPVKHNNRLD